MRSDDLVPLLTQGPGPGLRFHAGRIETWDPQTGANTISVAGTVLSNVPILNTGESIALKAGHIVGLLAWQSSYWILGRITVPGDPQFGAAAVAFGQAGDLVTGLDLGTAWSGLVSVQIPVPAWADEAIVKATGLVTVQNKAAGGDYLYAAVLIDGVSSPATIAWVEPAPPGPIIGALVPDTSRVLTSPGSVITVGVYAHTQSLDWPLDSLGQATVNAFAIFRSTT